MNLTSLCVYNIITVFLCVCVYPSLQPKMNECVCAISFIFQVYFGKSFKRNFPKTRALSITSKLAGVSCAKIIILSQDFHFVDPNLYCSAHALISSLPFTSYFDQIKKTMILIVSQNHYKVIYVNRWLTKTETATDDFEWSLRISLSRWHI